MLKKLPNIRGTNTVCFFLKLACEQQTHFRWTRAAKRFAWRKTFLANHGLALTKNQVTNSRLRKLICQDCGTDWWNKHCKRIHIEEKIRGHFYLFAYGVNDLSHVGTVFETINVLMTVDASCRLLVYPYLVARRKVCFGELFDSFSCAALDTFNRYSLFLIMKARTWTWLVIDFPCVVTSWFRETDQNFDQIESILYLFLHFFTYMFFSRF